MSKQCQVTKKKAASGHKYAIRGIAKKKKGIGLNITGKTKRRFQVNLVTKRLWDPENQKFVKLRLSTSALRTMNKKGVGAVLRELRKEGQKI